RLRDSRLPRTAGGVDPEPRRREARDAAALPRGPRRPAARLAEPARVARVAGQAERRAPGAQGPRAAGQAPRPDHPERRRAPPRGGLLPRPPGRDPPDPSPNCVPPLPPAGADP